MRTDSDFDLSQAVQKHDYLVGTRWRHVKGGVYEVLLVALREADMSLQVVYRSDATGIAFIRPLPEFMDGRFTQEE